MAEVVKTTFRLRRGDIKIWEENNPVLKKGEPGVAYENGRVKCLKIGDGISPWNKLEAIGAGEASVSGVSSVNGQQGIVQITPESIGAPTKEELEKINKELQKRLEKVEWKDVTEDFKNSDYDDEISFFLSLVKEGKYCCIPKDGSSGYQYYCDIKRGGNYHSIASYGDDGLAYRELYVHGHLSQSIEYAEGEAFYSNLLVGDPMNSYAVVNKSYVDDAITNALTTIDNAETLSF